MKRILLLSITLIVLTAIAFAQDSDTDQSAPDNEAVEFESEFGLQARIFQSVQQRSMNINASYTGRSNYLLTPGDIYVISMDNVAEGSSQSITNYSVQLQEDYTIDAPFIGTVSVEGLTLSELQQLLSERIKNSVPTQYVNVALETPAQFEIFLYGGVNLPGYITATPLLRVTDAIAMAHGFKPSGSYRSIRLERNGEILNLDLSRFYADANNEENPTLRPGDRIYIPEADVVTEIQGNVAFPGVYELKENETLADLLRFAGGLLPNAETSDITIVRVQEQNVTQRLSATASMADEIEIQNGDTVRIGSRFENSSFVILEGAVYGSSFSNDTPIRIPREPDQFQVPYFQEMSLYALLDAFGGPTPYAVEEDAFILRNTDNGEERIDVDVSLLWQNGIEDMELHPGDRVIIPMMDLQVYVTGEVSNAGSFPFQEGRTVSEYILLAGGIDRERGSLNAVYSVDENGNRTRISIDDTVEPGERIYVDLNTWTATQQTFSDIFIVTGWVTSIIGVTITVWDFIDQYILSQ